MQQNSQTDSEPTANGAERTAFFGPYALNLQTGELRKGNLKIRLQNKPFQILKALIEHPGSVVTREELRRRLWPEDTFVDFESGLNTAANRLRLALCDSAEHPGYVETLPRVGYRFIAAVHLLEAQKSADQHDSETRTLVVAPETILPSPPQTPSGGFTTAFNRFARPYTWLPIAVFLLLVVTLALLLAIVWVHFLQRQTNPVFHQLTFRRGVVDNARFTPSGEVVYSAAWDHEKAQLFLTDIGSPESRKLDFGLGTLSSLSKNSEVAFIRHDTEEYGPELVNVPLHGGSPRVTEHNVLFADWGADGALCLVRHHPKSMSVEYPAGTTIYTTSLGIETPRASPDGSTIALIEHPLINDDAGSILLLDRNGTVRHLTDNWASIRGVAWSANGKEVWFAAAKQGIDREVYAVNLKGQVRHVAAIPAILELFDIAPTGRVLIGRSISRLSLFVGDLKSMQVKDSSWLDWSHLAAISADGNRVLFDESGEGGGPLYTVYLHRRDRGTTERIANGRAMDLSPDGAWILIGNHAPSSQITVMSADGVQAPRTISAPGRVYQSAHFAGNAKTLVVQLSRGTSPDELYTQNVEDGTLRKVPNVAHLHSILVSSDGRRVASFVSPHQSVIVDLFNGSTVSIDNKAVAIPVGWTNDDQVVFAQVDREKFDLEQVKLPGMQRQTVGKLPAAVTPDQLMSVLVSRNLSTFAFSQVEHVVSLFAVDGWS